MAHNHNVSPFNSMPPAIVALALVIVGVELAFSLGARGLLGGPGAVGWRLDALQRFAFSNEIWHWMLASGQFPAKHLLRFFSYPFVHASFSHALFAAVMLLALGKMVGEALGTLRTLAILAVSCFGGALAYGFVSTPIPLIGAFPPVYGLIGGFTYLLWLRLGQMGAQQARAFSLIGILLGIQLLFGLLFGGSLDWVADLGGFASGFLLTMVLVPGGWVRLRERLRQRR